MVNNVRIIKVKDLDEWNLDVLIKESEQEGHRFVTKLVRQYVSLQNRFDRQGEVLYVATLNEEVVGVCGLNKDPYNEQKNIGRLRHLYVLSQFRNLGIAQKLLEQIKKDSISTFSIMTLRTSNPVADRFYTRNGFTKDEHTYLDSTHYYSIK
ncbi:GNAT family N-acetyltransferase [Bacillus sp. BGMRC 2118]|nr:GNAT family N-acetyltransferase [Bacillus sp. BGMRC 2118]